MTINVTPEVEASILAAVRSGQFRSVDEAVATAWLAWNRERTIAQPARGQVTDARPDPLLGLWKDDADEMDEIVADAYRQRREQSWRELDP